MSGLAHLCWFSCWIFQAGPPPAGGGARAGQRCVCVCGGATHGLGRAGQAAWIGERGAVAGASWPAMRWHGWRRWHKGVPRVPACAGLQAAGLAGGAGATGSSLWGRQTKLLLHLPPSCSPSAVCDTPCWPAVRAGL